jgi:UDP-glucose 4-epimerase
MTMDDNFSAKHILITGGLGYVGGRVAELLRSRDPDLVITLSSSCVPLRQPNWTLGYRIVYMDVRDRESVRAAVDDVDSIIHCAALNEKDCMRDVNTAWQVNTWGTQILLEEAHAAGVLRFIYFSTFHVYDPIAEPPITESSPTRPYHPYAATHRAAEDLVHFYRCQKGLSTLIFRLSNGCGYPLDSAANCWTLVFNDLCRQVMTTGRLLLKSSGQQHRDFISLHDVATACAHFLFDCDKNWDDGLFNLGGECSLSILSVARKVVTVYEKQYGKTIEEIETTGDSGTMTSQPVQYSINKLKRTGFRLVGDLNSEIEHTLKICANLQPWSS